ncbi:MAG: DNA-directed RNA polymerase subunit beta', partial [Lentisphaeria bacterium]|nr:DNA-directed RNA polymerase subunit beta' [Lentisphaeria bacterium]
MKALSDSSNVSIGVASPDVIRSWSKGEVKSPETINYRTLKAEKSGLFCERIFGPTKDYECACGKYKRQKYDGVICDRCGVEVTRARVRRERMGHIELECPVTHVWFYKCAPSRLGLLLEIPQKDLDKVLYYENYIVTDPGDTPLKLKQTLTNEEYAENVANYGDEFKASMGAEAIEILLKNIGLDTLNSELKDIPKRIEELSQRIKKSGKSKKAVDAEASEAMEFDKQTLADEKRELEERLKTLIERKRIVDTGKDNERMKALLETELDVLRSQVSKTNSQQIRKQKVKRIRLIEGFVRNNMDPTWMILKVLPVIPPDLRPLVPLDGGRFATSDLNDLYRRVLNRNARLHKFYESNCPDVITRNEKRMLQEAVDALMDNGRHGRPITGTGNRPLKSLTDMLKGKQGRFRQNLLGKRVDYSGRSVIVVGPELNINQCGLPKEMALRLFEPFIVRSLRQSGQVHTTRNAKKWIEERRKEVWDVLDNVVSGHPILLNRAPTLHRISIQAFDPVLIDGQAIRLHPLVCAAFNADFDGDQMAVHVPLSNEAQLEAKLIMLSPNNIFSPADGRPLALPSQDMGGGVYYLCYEDENLKNAFLDKNAYEQPHYDTYEEVLQAMEAHRLANENNRNSREPINVGLGIHDFFYFKNPYYRDAAETARIAALTGAEKEKQDIEDRKMVWGNRKERWIATTPGRMIYHEIWPEVLGFWNKKAVKKDIQNMIKQCHEVCGHEELLPLLDRLKNLGYAWATRSGFSIAIADMLIPAEKGEYIKQAEADVAAARQEQEKGSIDESVRSQKCIDIWTKVRDNLKGALQKTLKANAGHAGINSVWAMLESGARGNADQVNQVGGMRGLMSNTTGDVVETPIIHNFREGLTGLEYFNSTHGSRKGMADTALKTADAGYMTRRLVDVAHDVICTQEDCGTASGIWISALKDGNKETKSLTDRIVGRFSADDIYDSMGNLIVAAGEEITPYIASKIKEAGYEKVHIRSVLTCAASRGVCAKCYGRNLATGELPMEGDALGIIAAQSIGEPGTQLTLRTFHSGGTASTTASEKEIKVKWEQVSSELRSKLEDLDAKAKASGWSEKKLKDEKANLEEKENVAFLSFDNLEWIPGKDENNKAAKIVISRDGHIRAKNATFSRDSKKPVMGDVDLVTYDIPYGAILRVDNEQLVKPGDIIASVDPFTTPVIARQAGRIFYEDLLDGQTMRKTFNKQSGKHEMVVIQHPEDTNPALVIKEKKKDGKVLETESLSEGAQILVNDGDRVEAGQFIAKTPKTQAKTSDITTGLPRVAELFE